MTRQDMHELWAKSHNGTATLVERKLLFDTVNANRAVPPSAFVDAKPITSNTEEATEQAVHP